VNTPSLTESSSSKGKLPVIDASLPQFTTSPMNNYGASSTPQFTTHSINGVGPSSNKPFRSFTSHLQITIPTSSNPKVQMPSHETQKNYTDTPSGSGNNSQPSFGSLPKFFIYPERIVQEGVNSCKKSLLGKIISETNIHVSALKQGLVRIWNEPAGLTIQEIEGNILQFFMDKKLDRERILLGNPWTFRNSWLIIKPWDREVDPKFITFDEAPIWVKLWGLPSHCKTKLMGESLRPLMGTVEASKLYEYPGRNIIIKIKVSINVHNHICIGIHVGNPIDGTTWVDFRYENLPFVCFNCGLLGHGEKLCQNQPLELGNLSPIGSWFRSSQYVRRIMDPKDKKFHSKPSNAKKNWSL